MYTSSNSTRFHFRDLGVLLTGLAMIVAGFAALTNLTDWIHRWGTIPVYLSYFLYMSLAGRLFWKGADAAWAATKSSLTTAARHPRCWSGFRPDPIKALVGVRERIGVLARSNTTP
jgi:hypothetical protein